jgi:hypothetical protein
MVYKPIWLVYHLFAILNDVSFKDEESVNKDTSMVVIDQWYRLRLFERPVRRLGQRRGITIHSLVAVQFQAMLLLLSI